MAVKTGKYEQIWVVLGALVVTCCWARVWGWGRAESGERLTFEPENWKWNHCFLAKGESQFLERRIPGVISVVLFEVLGRHPRGAARGCDAHA